MLLHGLLGVIGGESKGGVLLGRQKCTWSIRLRGLLLGEMVD